MSTQECLQFLRNFLEETGIGSGKVNQIAETLDRYIRILMHWNKTHNLTGLKNYEDVFLKLVMDSLLFLKISSWFPVRTGDSFVDFGSGAGFPGIPLSLFFSESKFLLIESRKKKSSFLKFVTAELELRNVEVFPGRAEVFASKIDRKEHMPFRFVVSKAATQPGKVLEIAEKLVQKDGFIVIWTKPEKNSSTKYEIILRDKIVWEHKLETVEYQFLEEMKIATGFAIFRKREEKGI